MMAARARRRQPAADSRAGSPFLNLYKRAV